MWNLQSTWEALYQLRGGSYNRTTMAKVVREGNNLYDIRVQNLLRLGLLAGNEKVIVVGCGFGFIIEALMTEGFDVWGFDISTYIAASVEENTNSDVAARFTQADILDPNISQIVRQLVTGQMDVCLTEDVLTVIDPVDYATFFTNCENIHKNGNRNIHFVTDAFVEGGVKRPIPQDWIDHNMQWRTLDEWAAIVPVGHFIVSVRTFNMLEGAA